MQNAQLKENEKADASDEETKRPTRLMLDGETKRPTRLMLRRSSAYRRLSAYQRDAMSVEHSN